MSEKELQSSRYEMRMSSTLRGALEKHSQETQGTLSDSIKSLLTLGLAAYESQKDQDNQSLLSVNPEFSDINAWVEHYFHLASDVIPPKVTDCRSLVTYYRWVQRRSLAHGYKQDRNHRIREMERYLLSHFFIAEEVQDWIRWQNLIEEGLAVSTADSDLVELGERKQREIFEKVAADLKVNARVMHLDFKVSNIDMVGY
ncbi:hypothetical protein F9Z84_06590 [Escherichia coli]|nr:hypothetical protein F9Z84_06590 [Escherichia coli]